MNMIRLIYAGFPPPADKIGGVTILNPSGRVTIMINSIKPDEEQKRTLKHELAHIALGHLRDDRVKGSDFSYLDDNPEIESDADRFADQINDDTLAELMKDLVEETIHL